MNSAEEIEQAIADMGDEAHARQPLRFFKTGPGDYGEGDIFLGLTNPQVRMVVKESWRDTPVAEAVSLVRSAFHEVRLCGLLIMVEHYLRAMKKRDEEAMSSIFEQYLALHPHINNWDLVDLSAIKIAGNHEALHPGAGPLDDWIKPEGHTLWQQRIAMVSTWMLIRSGRPEAAFERAKQLIGSPHDILHKAGGWMLREAWKRGYRSELRQWLDNHVGQMTAVMLSYATEQMAADERRQWQQQRRAARGREKGRF